jgi:archaetidylinositol phosphate synthase
MAEFNEAKRVMTNWSASLERRCLVWMAQRMPRWVNSDHLTALGFLGTVMAGLSYWLARWHPLALLLVVFWLGVNWFGDSLDGTLARVRNCQRPRYGFYVDHVLDAFGAFFLLAGLGLSGYMSPLVAGSLLVVYYLLSIEVYLATYCLASFRLSFWKFGPTELRLLLAVGNVALIWHPTTTIIGPRLLLFDVGGVIGVACIAATVVTATVRNTIALYRAEPLQRAVTPATDAGAAGCTRPAEPGGPRPKPSYSLLPDGGTR